MASLKPGEYAFVVLGDGEYSFKGSGYVRGGIFDRVQLRQFGDIISFRDLDYQRLSDVYAEGMPEFREMAIFVARASQRFDPGSPWTLELLVRRQTGPVAGYSPASSWPARRPRNTWSRSQRPRNWPPWKRLPGRCGCGSGTRRVSRSGSSVPPSSCSWRSSSSRTAWCDGRA